MKKAISFLMTAVMSSAFSISALGTSLPSVGYVLVGPKNDGGWAMRHHQGFQSLKKHGYKVAMVETVSYTHLTLPTICSV